VLVKATTTASVVLFWETQLMVFSYMPLGGGGARAKKLECWDLGGLIRSGIHVLLSMASRMSVAMEFVYRST
jgi:hypothetical protein